MTHSAGTQLPPGSGGLPATTEAGARAPSGSGAGAGGLSFGPEPPSWAAHQDTSAATLFLCIVVAIVVGIVAALVAGGSGSPQFSFGMALGVSVGAVPYLLFMIARVGASAATGERPRHRRKLTEEEWDRIFRANHRAGGSARAGFSGSATGADGAQAPFGDSAELNPEQELLQAYRFLGLQPDATTRAITVAYRRLAHQYHPDKVADHSEEARQLAEQRMKQLNAAYAVLKRRIRQRRHAAERDAEATRQATP